VIFHLDGGVPDAASLVQAAREQGVLLSPFGPRTVRATTHLDVNEDQCARAAAVIAKLAASW